MERFKVNIYIEKTIKPPQRRDAKAMWLVEYIVHGQTITRQGMIEQEKTTSNQITLSAMIEALEILTKPCEIRINTKAEGVFYPIANCRNIEWKKNGWKNSRGEEIKNADLWEKLTELMERHVCSFTCEDHSFQDYMKSELEKTA